MIAVHMESTPPRDLLIPHPFEGLNYVQAPRRVARTRGAGTSPHARLRRASRAPVGTGRGGSGLQAKAPNAYVAGGLLTSNVDRPGGANPQGGTP